MSKDLNPTDAFLVSILDSKGGSAAGAAAQIREAGGIEEAMQSLVKRLEVTRRSTPNAQTQGIKVR